MRIKKPELLAPAGSYEKLKTAVHFGADAVYMGGKNFSLRNFAGNFSDKEMIEGIKFAKDHNVKTYITCNIFPDSTEINEFAKYLAFLSEIKPDALIIADPGVLELASNYAPEIPVHLSTQANTTNHMSANFWKKSGVSRVNLARELSLDQIKIIRENSDIELEIFIHGAMCVSYSGRCLLSSFMSKRSANKGKCSHPCRWKYHVREELRPGEYYPVMEDDRGTYIFNSKDMCMIEHIDKVIESGVDSLKIEGRMKGTFYLGSVVKAYREAIDRYFEDKTYSVNPQWTELLASVANRKYCTGFLLNDPDSVAPNIENIKPDNVHNYLGTITDIKEDALVVSAKNRILQGEEIKILSQGKDLTPFKVEKITDLNNNIVEKAKPNETFLVYINSSGFSPGDILFKV
ncbi:MAG: U32 family peptidase [Desulfobacteraceae bacterium]|nr:U32 family peptidase [Desulfobacteraceae bacterium]